MNFATRLQRRRQAGQPPPNRKRANCCASKIEALEQALEFLHGVPIKDRGAEWNLARLRLCAVINQATHGREL